MKITKRGTAAITAITLAVGSTGAASHFGLSNGDFKEACAADTPDAFCTTAGLSSNRFSREDMKPFMNATILNVHARLSAGRAVNKDELAFITGAPEAVGKMEEHVRRQVQFTIDKYGIGYDQMGMDGATVSRKQLLSDYLYTLEVQGRMRDNDAAINSRPYQPIGLGG